MTSSRLCTCGCGQQLSGSNKWLYVRGHKPKGSAQADDLNMNCNQVGNSKGLYVCQTNDK
jgi:hypothetical protein